MTYIYVAAIVMLVSFVLAARKQELTVYSGIKFPNHDKEVYEFPKEQLKTINGEFLDLTQFKGKLILATNVASKCGYTDVNYKNLMKLLNEPKLKNKLVILAFPSNSFGKQEPGSAQEILEFVSKNYQVPTDSPHFIFMEKKPIDEHPYLNQLKKLTYSEAFPIAWNFETKFLITPAGEVFRYSNAYDPLQLKYDLIEKLDRKSEL